MGISKRTILTHIEVVEDITCDRCEKSTKDEFNMNYEFARIAATWGYGSKKDGEKHEIFLCEKCYDFIIKEMGIDPKIEEYF